jgi:hypothetical protein
MSRQSERLARLQQELADLTSDADCRTFTIDLQAHGGGIIVMMRRPPTKFCPRCGNRRVPTDRRVPPSRR